MLFLTFPPKYSCSSLQVNWWHKLKCTASMSYTDHWSKVDDLFKAGPNLVHEEWSSMVQYLYIGSTYSPRQSKKSHENTNCFASMHSLYIYLCIISWNKKTKKYAYTWPLLLSLFCYPWFNQLPFYHISSYNAIPQAQLHKNDDA